MKPLRFVPLALLLLVGLTAAGCASVAPLPRPAEVQVPTPREDNVGAYLSPFTSDGTIAPWVAKGTAAKLGAAVGGYAGRKAGEKALEQVPLIGGLLGRRVGQAAGRAAALKLVGGEDYMRETSDLSFDTVDALIVYLYAHYTEHEEWAKVFDLTKSIYPDVEARWVTALKEARQG